MPRPSVFITFTAWSSSFLEWTDGPDAAGRFPLKLTIYSLTGPESSAAFTFGTRIARKADVMHFKSSRITKTFKILLGLAVLSLLELPISAATYHFTNITGNSPANALIGEMQLSVEVTDAGGGQVLFTFLNLGPQASSITDVYFDDGTLLGIAEIIDGSGVFFAVPATPPNLPGGNSINPPFVVTQGFSADSDPPAQPNGVNPGETLAILFDLQLGATFQDVIDDLQSGALRIGIHVQGFGDGGSESFVNAVNTVPEPAPLLLLAIAFVGLSCFRRREGLAKLAANNTRAAGMRNLTTWHS